MCSRRDTRTAREAQDAAADALASACFVACGIGSALRSVYDDTLREPIPARLSEVLGRLQ